MVKKKSRVPSKDRVSCSCGKTFTSVNYLKQHQKFCKVHKNNLGDVKSDIEDGIIDITISKGKTVKDACVVHDVEDVDDITGVEEVIYKIDTYKKITETDLKLLQSVFFKEVGKKWSIECRSSVNAMCNVLKQRGYNNGK